MANIKRYLDKIRTAIYGKEVRGSLADGLEAINNETEDATEVAVNVEQRQDAVEQQFDDVLNEWTDDKPISNEETIAARTNRNTNENYGTIGQRMDAENKKVNAQLAQTAHDNFKTSPVSHKSDRKPSITIIDDDGHPFVYTKLKPIAEEYGIPITSAVIPGAIEGAINREHITLQQMYELQRLGFEFVSHTYTHPELATLTESEIHNEMRLTQEWLNKHGFDGYTSIVYPYGSTNSTVAKIARQYYKSGFNIDSNQGTAIQPPLDTYNIYRIFNSYGKERAKSEIDKAAANNGWVVYSMHVWYDTWSDSETREVIEYALSKGLEFTTVKEGLEMFGNVLDVPDEDGFNTVIGADGSSNIPIQLRNVTYTSGHAINEYPLGKITYTRLRGHEATVGKFPNTKGGILITHRLTDDWYAIRQEYIVSTQLNNGIEERYVRYLNNDRTWGEWLSDVPTVHLINKSYTTDTPISEFPLGKITYTRLRDYEATTGNFPTKKGGILITHRLTADWYVVRQEYIVSPPLNSMVEERYVRYLKNDNTWEDWLSNRSEYSVTLQNGWSGSFKVRHNELGHINAYGSLTVGTKQTSTIIGQLPSGIRPITITPFTVVKTSTSNPTSHIGGFISNTGNIVIRQPLSDQINIGDVIEFNFTFLSS